MRFLKYPVILSLLVFGACASTQNGNSNFTRRNRDSISTAEIRANSAANAYDLIHNLRPHWLRGRGTRSIKNEQASFPYVYVNESRHGDIQSLRNLATENITEIQFLNPGDATNRFGLGHASGAILITMY
ncbi:MAG: hypothetical protein ACE5HS_08740 [bacterium]